MINGDYCYPIVLEDYELIHNEAIVGSSFEWAVQRSKTAALPAPTI